jgi:FkbM family methyltransferase
MLVDRHYHYNIVREPAQLAAELAMAARSPLTDLRWNARAKLKAIRALMPQFGAIVRGRAAFSDRSSRRLFDNLLVYRYLTPHLSSIVNKPGWHADVDAFMAEPRSPVAALGEPTMMLGQPLKIWQAGSHQIATTRYGLYWAMHIPQYYFRRAEIEVSPQVGDVIFDCGAFAGETTVKFAADVGPNGMIYSFDPSPRHIAIAREVLERNGPLAARVRLFVSGISHTSRTGHPVPENPNVASPGRPLQPYDSVVSIDEFVNQHGLNKVDYLKMDIEGSEQAALDGAHQTILRFKPKLAVCVYHKPDDLWRIPATLKSRYPFYRFFLEHYSLHYAETVLYARVA